MTLSEEVGLSLRDLAKAAFGVQKAADLKGSMVALHPSKAAAESLAAKGGEPADRLHVTLCYVPAEVGADPKLLHAITAGWAKTVPPLDAEVTGHTTFTGGEEPAHVALVSVPGLDQHRARLADSLERAGIEYSKQFGFTPHVTIGYGEEAPDMPKVGTRLRFRSASSVSGMRDRKDHRFAGVAKAAPRAVSDMEHAIGEIWSEAKHPRDPLSGRWIVTVDNRTNTADAQGLSLDEAASRVAEAHRRGRRNVKAMALVARGRVQQRPLTAAEQKVLVAATTRKVKAG